jgi:hypothetical protein
MEWHTFTGIAPQVLRQPPLPDLLKLKHIGISLDHELQRLSLFNCFGSNTKKEKW